MARRVESALVLGVVTSWMVLVPPAWHVTANGGPADGRSSTGAAAPSVARIRDGAVGPEASGAEGSLGARIVVSGTWAYVADGDLVVVDTSAPACPRPFRRLPQAGPVDAVALGSHVLFAAGPRHLAVYELTDPSSPAVLADTAIDGPLNALVGAREDVAWLDYRLSDTARESERELLAVDATVPREPRPIHSGIEGWNQGTGRVWWAETSLEGDWITIVVLEAGLGWHTTALQFVDATNPREGMPTSPFEDVRTGHRYQRPHVEGSRVYVGDAPCSSYYDCPGPPELVVLDLAAASAPQLLATNPGQGAFWAIDARRAFTVRGARDLAAVDLADPDRPRVRGSIGLSADPIDVVARRGLAYVLEEGWPNLEVVDATDLDAPKAVCLTPLAVRPLPSTWLYVPSAQSLARR